MVKMLMMSMSAFCVVTPCSLLGKYPVFQWSRLPQFSSKGISTPKSLHLLNSIFNMHCTFQECNMPWGYHVRKTTYLGLLKLCAG